MRYMMLVYSTEPPDGLSPQEALEVRSAHREVIQQAGRKGILQGAEPLAPNGYGHNGKKPRWAGSGNGWPFCGDQRAVGRILHSGLSRS